MKRVLALLPLLVISLLLFAFPTKTYAGILPNGSPCITVPANLLSSLCSSGFCKSLTQNLPGLPGVCVEAAKCKCTGTNTYQCTLGGQTQNVTCHNVLQNYVCANSAGNVTSRDDVFGGKGLKGIICQPSTTIPPPAPPCKTFQYSNGTGKCLTIVTSFGDVGTDPGAFISRLFSILLGVAGTIALLLLMRAGYRIMTSRGNPEGIQQGREQLIAAIVGLLFLIFSFVLLQVIGVDLLKIPTFSGAPTGNNVGPGVACKKLGGGCTPRQACGGASGRSLGASDCGDWVCCK